MMGKILLVFLVLFSVTKVFCQNDARILYVDSLISKNKLTSKFKLDSGVTERVHHKLFIPYHDLYLFDSLSKNLLSCEHWQDSVDLISYMAFYYSADKIVKIDYRLSKAAGDDGVQDLYQIDYYYEGRIMSDSIEYTPWRKKLKLFTPNELYEIGMNYLKKYNSEFK